MDMQLRTRLVEKYNDRTAVDRYRLETAPTQVPPTFPSDQDATGRTLGDEEIAAVTEVIRSGCLFSVRGTMVKKFEAGFAGMIGIASATASSSGSAALHAAVAAIDPEPGEEIITTSITDMGALTAILAQGAVPVFADVDPLTGNVTAKTILDKISSRTRAIVVTLLFGNPCRMKKIMALAKFKSIPVIEDCAQAFLASVDGQRVGTIGDIGCFSLQQGKHITTGEGGITVTDNAAYARRVKLFVNKAWGYGDTNPDHYFLAPNYRMTELQGAVAFAQLAKLEWVVESRRDTGDLMTRILGKLPGIRTPEVAADSTHVYWKYPLLIDPEVIPGGTVGLSSRLKDHRIVSIPRYIQKPAFECAIFRDQKTFGNSRFPFSLARPEAIDYNRDNYPGTYRYLDRVLVLPWNEKYTEIHLDYLAQSILTAADYPPV